MPYVDAPKTEITVGEKNPRILIVAADLESEIVSELVKGTIDGLTKSGVLRKNIFVETTDRAERIPALTRDILVESISSNTKSGIYAFPGKEYGYDAVVAVGIFVEEDVPSGFDELSMEAYNAVLDVTLETQVPVVMGILTCYDYEQGLERAGIGRKTKGMNHGYFWATAALSEIRVREMYCHGKSDVSIFEKVRPDTQQMVENAKEYAICCAQWNMEVNSEIVLLLAELLVSSGKATYNTIHVYSASGSFELPGLANYLGAVSPSGGSHKKFEAVFCIGSLIQGGTKHFKFIGDSVELAFKRIKSVKVVSGVLVVSSMNEAKHLAGIEVDGRPGKNIAYELVKELD
ncbi:6,7-dimethyl-8-ribityllumazine synthase [Smittium mucronatum]|uniref:6,7-dimethyl-8-ribityllumazine synthase n=1 Tax=Smittium mucronatum TaxID=133383 RepID=A0A1R0GLI0_9FUNG|nr:6,7-dimethyl-8-ribityllumazine synthase [Smittium mucronatum]